MLEVNATEFKGQFGQYMDSAGQQSIRINKSGRPIAVMLPEEEYEYFQMLEDAYLGVQAQMAADAGEFVSHEEVMQIIHDRLASGE